MKGIEEASLLGKLVLVRIGADVPLTEEKVPRVRDDSRLRVLLPTIQYLINRKARIVLCSHLGRPDGTVDRALSMRPVYLRLSALLRKPVTFAPTLFSEVTEKAVEELKEGEIIGLENLRFERGEEANSRTFARKLAKYGEIYVNEAFSVSHREAASIVAITEFLPSYAGLQFEKEVSVLRELLRNPARPFTVIIGGAKVSDKLPAIKYLVQHADSVLVGGGVANTFIAASGKDVGESLIDGEYLEVAKNLLKRYRNKIILPTDYIIEKSAIMDIGQNSTEQFLRKLKNSKTIFWNGTLGVAEDEDYSVSSEILAHYIADSPATTVVGGGNTIEVLSKLSLLDKVTFVSTGGGSTLQLMSGKTLPGLAALS